MIQKKFLCNDAKAAEGVIPEIRALLSETPHKSAVLTFYEHGLSSAEVTSLMEKLRKETQGGLPIAGLSITMIAELMPQGSGILMNLILTEEAELTVVTLPCSPGGEDAAAEALNSRLKETPFPRAVELFESNMAIKTTRFLTKAMEGFEETVLFGTSTLRNLPTRLSVLEEEQVVEIEQMDPDYMGDEFVYGDTLLYDGFAVVIFSGEHLLVQAEYALGWSPIGRRLSPVFEESDAKGETVVRKINAMPAVDIFREYLGVYPDVFLISNICEFPFIVEREGISICLIPIDCGRDGELYYMMTLNPGETFRFSFASHEDVLEASLESLYRLEALQPEALFLTLCGNRINFLKEDAHMEWDGFRILCPDYALMHGACELYYHRGKGGILNSAHLAIGFREGDIAGSGREYDNPDVESFKVGHAKPLSERMSVFLRKITTELRDALREAKDANNAKSSFLSHMSHEIRTPINAILGMDEMILRESSESEILDYAEDIRSAGNNLLGIVNDVLDFSKIEAGRMNIIPVEYELASVVNDLYNVVSIRSRSKGLGMELAIDPTIPAFLFGDETRLKQIITNLLTNAVKYTEKGTVTLTIKKLSENAPEDRESLSLSCPGEQYPDHFVRLSVSVKDTGIGIKEEDMKKLFQSYERLEEKRNRTVEGTGLGLPITSELLSLMGSRLFVTSTYGEGSLFGFELVQGVVRDEPVGDLSSRLKKTNHTPYRVRFTAQDARILVVDDTKVNLDVIRNLLKKTGITVDTALSGEEALKLVAKNAYDVIFLDHLMPGMDGPETLKRMRAMENSPSAHAPAISLTANALSGARDEYLKAGFKDYLSKPVNSTKLEEMLFSCLPPEKIRTVSEPERPEEHPEASLLPVWLLHSAEIQYAEGLKNCSTAKTYRIVLESFYETIRENADEIEKCVRKKDWNNFTIRVHALKSSSRTIGALTLSEEAALLEQAGDRADREVIERDTPLLLAHYRSLLEELSPLGETGDQGSDVMEF